ncbi:hypothetical protein J8C06_14230 [Chloracidobacterium validum]|uniref:Peptidase M50B-like protein n=1 Tax=Chloracidobacterium validum TaxID=2821543 RepID=A0ABX8BB86_9BACT|nr:hypothetical protein [Chloracidobacterium validum]QUW04196.1 hypothetical protein J8C06_14230 [Chloracidobacterium validum]
MTTTRPHPGEGRWLRGRLVSVAKYHLTVSGRRWREARPVTLVVRAKPLTTRTPPIRMHQTCPHCQLRQPLTQTSCARCGLALPLGLARQVEWRPPLEAEPTDAQAYQSVIGGALLAAVVVFVPFFAFISFVLHPLVTLVHELGHTIAGWVYGYPSIPAFDFVYGGGVTIHQDRKWLLVGVWYVAFAGLFYYFRANTGTLLLITGLAAAYTLTAVTSWHEAITIAMGHGGELIFATVFLYRAWSGESLVHALERPLYAFAGFYIQLYDLRFAYQLLTSQEARLDYEDAKGGGHWMDFSRLANDFFGSRFLIVVLAFFIACLLPPVVAWLLHRYRPHWRAWVIDRLTLVP